MIFPVLRGCQVYEKRKELDNRRKDKTEAEYKEERVEISKTIKVNANTPDIIEMGLEHGTQVTTAD